MQKKLFIFPFLFGIMVSIQSQDIDSSILAKEINSVESRINSVNYQMREQYLESKATMDSLHKTNRKLEGQIDLLLQNAGATSKVISTLNDSINSLNKTHQLLYIRLLNKTRHVWWFLMAFILLFAILLAYLVLIRRILLNSVIYRTEILAGQNTEILNNTAELFKVKKTLKTLRAEQKKLFRLKAFNNRKGKNK